jgi:pSer/pThr/pTyr-binding forkhead associated (FHA) protein
MVINISEKTQNLHITRSLVDEGDSTISSGSHAYIYKEGNEWKIENKASNKAVFLQVNDISTLKNGDIIMMGGDKFYVFVDESQQ